MKETLRFSRPTSETEYWLTRQLKGCPVERLPSLFKLSLATRFSKETNQDLPVGFENSISLFSTCVESRIRTTLKTKRQRVVGFWNLMQAKSLSNEVPNLMIKDAYLQHSKTLSLPASTSEEILSSIRELVRPWAKDVAKRLPSQLSALPKKKAYFDWKRSEGGLKQALLPRIHIRENERFDIIQPSAPRLEPTCIILSGKPGTGKSLVQSLLAKRLSKHLNLPFDETVYLRNSSMKHWDCYDDQPLVMVDDFLQIYAGQSNCPDEIKEFITLNSTTDYRLPMAHLTQKGKKFTSPLLLYSTNWEHVMTPLNKFVTCPEAAQRRFHQFDISKDRHGRVSLSTMEESSLDGCRTPFNRVEVASKLSKVVDYLFQFFINSWKKKSSFYRHVGMADGDQPIEQVIGFSEDKKSHLYVTYPQEPIDEAVVMTHAIPEPLKVRMITKGHPHCHVLKPLQKAMFQSLDRYPCFKPCFGPDYLEELQGIFDDSPTSHSWVSGDYSAATDKIHQDVMVSVMEEVILALGKGHALVPYITWEMGTHEVHYPTWTSIDPIQQVRGQLMGSLLSFPVLCLANACTLAISQNRKMEDLPGLVHGDDLAFRTNKTGFKAWKDTAKAIGFELSVGKNYIDPAWVSIDSQVFYVRNKSNKVTRGLEETYTGKYKCLARDNSLSETFKQCWERGFSRNLIVHFNKTRLLKTPQSLDVSFEYGGIGGKDMDKKPRNDRDRLIYLGMRRQMCPRQREKFDDGRFVVDCPESLLPYRPLFHKDLLRSLADVEDETADTEKVFNILRKEEKHRKGQDLSWLDDYTPLSIFSNTRDIIMDKQQFILLKARYWMDIRSQEVTLLDRKYFDAMKKINTS